MCPAFIVVLRNNPLMNVCLDLYFSHKYACIFPKFLYRNIIFSFQKFLQELLVRHILQLLDT
jgi:hypothetical protein